VGLENSPASSSTTFHLSAAAIGHWLRPLPLAKKAKPAASGIKLLLLLANAAVDRSSSSSSSSSHWPKAAKLLQQKASL
jgi:hypothetical protein